MSYWIRLLRQQGLFMQYETPMVNPSEIMLPLAYTCQKYWEEDTKYGGVRW